ncbi:hypothetical protein FRB95_010767 [Tulasnella sp. JGI-2019a]|nr:hypothetical protein FRB95_010767 [Tulasnella sp. JGI-2019a]
MILAKEFSRSAVARQSDFSTSSNERGIFLLQERSSKRKRLVRGSLIAQFAANEATSFADAAELIWPHIDGIDLNCGCPQPWAYKERIGSFLLRQPDTVRDIINTTRDRVGQNFPISIKIRVDSDLKRTDQLIQTAIHAGASHISVHGRTRHQPSTAPVSLDSISFAVESTKGAVPIVANGDAWSFVESEDIRKTTGVQGVMSARGLLANPAMFAGYDRAPIEAIKVGLLCVLLSFRALRSCHCLLRSHLCRSSCGSRHRTGFHLDSFIVISSTCSKADWRNKSVLCLHNCHRLRVPSTTWRAWVWILVSSSAIATLCDTQQLLPSE